LSFTNDSFVNVSISVDLKQLGCISVKVSIDLKAIVKSLRYVLNNRAYMLIYEYDDNLGKLIRVQNSINLFSKYYNEQAYLMR